MAICNYKVYIHDGKTDREETFFISACDEEDAERQGKNLRDTLHWTHPYYTAVGIERVRD